MFDELSITFDDDTALEVYALARLKQPDRDTETYIRDNLDFVKRNYDPSKHSGNYLDYIMEAMKNNYADSGDEKIKPILETLVDIFCIEDRAKIVYNNVINQHPNLNSDELKELIQANIDFAKKKQKVLGARFLPYLQKAIEKDMAGYGRNVQKSNA